MHIDTIQYVDLTDKLKLHDRWSNLVEKLYFHGVKRNVNSEKIRILQYITKIIGSSRLTHEQYRDIDRNLKILEEV